LAVNDSKTNPFHGNGFVTVESRLD